MTNESTDLSLDDGLKDERIGKPTSNVVEANVSLPASAPVSMRRIFGLAKPESPMLCLALLLMIIAEALTLYNPLLLAKAYNVLVDPSLSSSSERMSLINDIMIQVLVIQVVAVSASFIRSAIMGTAGERVAARLRNQLYAAMLRQEIAFFDQHSSGDLVSRLNSDTTLMQQATGQATPEVVLGTIKVLVAVALMFWISPSLAGVVLGLIFTLFLACMPIGKRLGGLSKSYQDVLGQAQSYATEVLGAIRTVQSFAAEEREQKRYQAVIGDPAQSPWWFPTKTKSNKTTSYHVGFYKAMSTSAMFAIVLGFGFCSLYLCGMALSWSGMEPFR
jgi:ABC-type multidrug transport system fused ATPase/permease subunit